MVHNERMHILMIYLSVNKYFCLIMFIVGFLLSIFMMSIFKWFSLSLSTPITVDYHRKLFYVFMFLSIVYGLGALGMVLYIYPYFYLVLDQ